MKKRIFIIVLLLAGSIAMAMFTNVKKADAWIAHGFYLDRVGECDICIKASTSCNVSSQCCDYWPECNEGLPPD